MLPLRDKSYPLPTRYLRIAALGAAAILSGCGSGTASSGPSATASGASALPTATASGASALPTADPLDQLIAAAKAEGSVTFYTGFTEADTAAAAALFGDKYGIKVDVYRADTNQVLARYAAEMQAGNVQADLLALADIGASATLQHQDALMEYVPPATQDEAFDSKYRGTFYQVVGSTIWPAAWNSEVVSQSDSPLDYSDFLKPFWKGKLGSLDASVSLVGLQQYYILRQTLGVDFMKQLGAQNFTFLSPNNAIAEQLVSGELLGAHVMIIGVIKDFQAKGAPLGSAYMKTGTPVLTRTLQVAAKAPHPNAAKLFENFLLTQEGQQGFQASAKSLSPRSDVTVEGIPTSDELVPLTLDDPVGFLMQVDALRAEFTQYFKAP